MSTRQPQPQPSSSKSPFFQQRDALVTEIALFSKPLKSFENVLQNINKLNRSLEGVIAVGNEFGAVEALWSQFEGMMAQDEDSTEGKESEKKDGHDAEQEDVEDAGPG
ncbi:MAG: hypothetical protein Q9163_000521 [Psora crenata]